MSTSDITIPLNDGTSIPWLAFGTGTALYSKDATEFVRVAIDNGVTHLDGAQLYGNEDTLGAGIKASGKPRSSLYVTTKLAKVPTGATVKDTLVDSLEKLGLDYVDLFLIHVPVHHSDLKSVWKQFEQLKAEGLTKSIGVSNFQVKDLETILDGATVVPAVNQIEYHPYILKAAQPIVDFGKKHGIVTASYGGLTPIVRAAGGPLDPVLETIRARLEKTRGKTVTTGQVLTKWIHQKGVVVITTTSKQERVLEYLDTANVPELTAEEIKAVDDAGYPVHKRVYLRQVFGEE